MEPEVKFEVGDKVIISHSILDEEVRRNTGSVRQMANFVGDTTTITQEYNWAGGRDGAHYLLEIDGGRCVWHHSLLEKI